MSSANVLPSAPGYDVIAVAQQQHAVEPRATTETTQSLYPVLPNGENFRLTKINEIAATLNQEVEHYRLIAKKYKQAHTFAHTTAVTTGGLSVLLSGSSLTTSLTGFGVVVGAPWLESVPCVALYRHARQFVLAI